MRSFRPNVVTYTALVNMLCKEGKINEICDLVCKMEKDRVVLDAIFYSSWICGYFKQGILDEAFRKHRLMVENGIKPDTVSYTILIDGFSKEGNVEKAIGFLKEMKKDGVKPNLITYTAIMRGFCKIGKLEEAFGVFRKIEDLGIRVDEVTYAILIDGVCRWGDFDRVFHLLEEMEKKGITSGVITYNTVINGLCKVGRTSEANEISKGIICDNFTYSTLLHGHIVEKNVMGILETKKRLEEAGVCMDVVMCNVLIKALFMVGALEDAYMIFKGMPEMGLAADSFTYCTMIDAYCKVGCIDKALKIFDEYRRTSFSGVASYNCIIHGLCGNGMVGLAVEVFIEFIEKGFAPDKVIYMMLMKAIFRDGSAEGVLKFLYKIEKLDLGIYNIIYSDAVCFLCKKGFPEVAFDVYMVMKRKGSTMTSNCHYSILKGLIKNGNLWLVRILLNVFVKEFGIVEPMVSKILINYLCEKDVKEALRFFYKMKEENLSVSVPDSVIKALTKDGRVLESHKLVMKAEEKQIVMDLVSYSIVVDGLCKAGHLDKALDLCATMKTKGLAPNIITYNSVINGLCRQGCLVEAFRLFDSLEAINLVPTDVTYATLIDALSKEGFLLDAKRLFERMVSNGLTPNTHVYNSLIDGNFKFGLMEEAWKLLLDLEKSCFQPDAFTVSAVINGHCRKGDMEGALGFFFEYKTKGILPDFLGFIYLTKGLFAKGRMEEARSILREMLQAQSVMELLNRAGDEIETESIASFLISLCEQGSIQEAIFILNEVGSVAFPFGRKLKKLHEGEAFDTSTAKSSTSAYKTDLDLGFFKTDKSYDAVGNYDNSVGKSFCSNFDDHYSIIATLCSKGELQKANRVAKEMLLN